VSMIDMNTLGGGALLEKIEIEMRKLADNVLDPNTKPDATRTLKIEIKIKPNESRQIGLSEINVKASLAPSKGIPTSFIFDYDSDGVGVMKELQNHDRNQLRMNNDAEVTDGTGNVVNMVSGAKNFR
jgi:hypothetical protein